MRYGLPKFSDFLEPSAREQVAFAHEQHASLRKQDPSASAHMIFETQKTSGGHISLKTCPNRAL